MPCVQFRCFPLDIPLRASADGGDENGSGVSENEYIVVLCIWKRSQSSSEVRLAMTMDGMRLGQSETPVIGFAFRKNSIENQAELKKM